MLLTASVAGNPWDALDSHPQVDDEMTREQAFLDCILETDLTGEFVSRAHLQTFLGSYTNQIFRPLRAQMITVS